MFLDFLDYLTCWMFVETPLCFQFTLQDAVAPYFKVLLNVNKNHCWRTFVFEYVSMGANKAHQWKIMEARAVPGPLKNKKNSQTT